MKMEDSVVEGFVARVWQPGSAVRGYAAMALISYGGITVEKAV